MSLPQLTAVVLARDAAGQLPRCLASVRGLAGQLLVVDTGSADDTVAVARAAGAQLRSRPWDGDFAAARNAALEWVRTEWVLSVDADEEARGDPDGLARLLGSGAPAGDGRADGRADGSGGACADAFAVEVANPYPGTTGVEAHLHSPVRLFRRGAARWVGAVHEQVRGPGGGDLAVTGCPRSVLSLRHSGYIDPTAVRVKAARNAALARQRLDRLDRLAGVGPQAAAERARALLDLGRSLLADDDLAAAAGVLEEAAGQGGDTWAAVQALDFLARIEVATGRWAQAGDRAAQLRRAGADGRYCNWLAGRALLGAGEPRRALEVLRGVDAVIDTLGCDLGTGSVLETRAQAAALAGEEAEAIACLLLAMAVHGRVAGRGPDLLRLWGARPAAGLAELIRSAAAEPGTLEALQAELRRSGDPGPAVAAALPPPSVSARPDPPRPAPPHPDPRRMGTV